jgi:Abnormal spindle-like microcephaly-assoc'd, ASPM-SPD-2-Hydin
MLRRSVLAVAISATMILNACAGGVSRDSAGLSTSVLVVSPSTLNFGNVAVNKAKTMSGTLTADNSDVTVSSAEWNGEGYAVTSITFPVTLTAGQSVSFDVTFSPPSTGSFAGTISFLSNASNSPSTETLSGGGVPHTVDLTWDPSTSQVMGYNIYRGTHSGGPYSKLNSSLLDGTSFTDGGVESGGTYFYVAKSVDANSRESSRSNEAKVVIPNP